MIWLQVAMWWLVASYLFMGVWVAGRVDWASGVRFHSRKLPVPRTTKTNMVLAGIAQVAVIVLLWPFYDRVRLPFYIRPGDR